MQGDTIVGDEKRRKVEAMVVVFVVVVVWEGSWHILRLRRAPRGPSLAGAGAGVHVQL